MWDDAQLLDADPKRRKLLAAPLRVDDDAVEPVEEHSPQPSPRRRSPGDDVVGAEDRRASRSKEPAVGLDGAEPLDVEDIRPEEVQPRHSERVLERLDRQSQTR
jgi:hypothetical protein